MKRHSFVAYYDAGKAGWVTTRKMLWHQVFLWTRLNMNHAMRWRICTRRSLYRWLDRDPFGKDLVGCIQSKVAWQCMHVLRNMDWDHTVKRKALWLRTCLFGGIFPAIFWILIFYDIWCTPGYFQIQITYVVAKMSKDVCPHQCPQVSTFLRDLWGFGWVRCIS